MNPTDHPQDILGGLSGADNSHKSLHTFTRSYPEPLRGEMSRVRVARPIHPPAEGVAGAHELFYVDRVVP